MIKQLPQREVGWAVDDHPDRHFRGMQADQSDRLRKIGISYARHGKQKVTCERTVLHHLPYYESLGQKTQEWARSRGATSAVVRWLKKRHS